MKLTNKIGFLISTIRQKKKESLLTENFTCSSNKIICFGIFIYDSNQELTFDIELSLPPGNKVEPSLRATANVTTQVNSQRQMFPSLVPAFGVADRRKTFLKKEAFGSVLFC